MKVPRPLRVIGLLAGFCGLPAGLFLLEKAPLFGVLAMLGAMALLSGMLGNLAEAEHEVKSRRKTISGEY
jgi:hypothetical protein